MSDQEDKDSNKKRADGMVRVRRRVRKRRTNQKSPERAKEDANSLFGKAKELLIGMQEEDEDYGPVDVAEQVRRLKKKKEDNRPLDDVWGTKRRSSMWLWMVLAGVIVSVVAIVVGVAIWVSEEPVKAAPSIVEDGRFDTDEADLSEGPLAWFDTNSVDVLNEVKSVIIGINKATEVKEISKLVRDSPFRSVHPIRVEDWGSPMRTNSLSKFQWDPRVVYSSEQSGAKERGYLKVSGKREDLSSFDAYFVLQGKKVVLDWDASLGWSEMSVPELVKEKPRKPMFLRCRVKKENSFDQMFGDTNYSGYVLSGESPDEFFFAYVDLDTARGKAMDRDLRLLLNFGSFVTDKPPLKNVKATMRVGSRKDVGKDGIFEIVEYLHDGWVTP